MNRKTTNSILLFLCVAAIGFFTSCSSDDDNSPQPLSSTQVINNIKNKLYKDGKIFANKTEGCSDKEYVIVTESGANRPCTVFTELTGIEAPLKESYEYIYTATDGTCKIRIKGNKEAINGKYATLFFDIPTCSEITVLHIGTPAFFYDNNLDQSPSGGHPVIW